MKKKILALLLSLALVLPFIGGLTVPAEAAGNKLIAINFDDGPGNFTGSLLAGLASTGAPATFFMRGANGGYGAKQSN